MGGFRVATAEDVPRINGILNHPTVRPHIAPGDHQLDFAANIGVTPAYVSEGGILFAEAMGFGDYLSLSAFLPEARGLHAVVGHRKALDHFFSTTDCLRIFAVVDESNRVAIRNLNGLGFRYEDTEAGDRWVFSLDWVGWAKASRATLAAARPYVQNGWVSSPAEALLLGGFLLTVRGGWTGKALSGFNRWATFAGLEGIHPLLEDEPLFTYRGRLLHANKLLSNEVVHG